MSRLYFRGLQPEALAGYFVREGELVGKRGLRQMRQVAKLVMEQSIKNSPVDWKGKTPKDPPGHELELAHHIDEGYGTSNRIETIVWVGGMVGDVDVDLYATWIHESFDYRLGKASQEKTMRGPDYQVGPLFLERALAKYDSDFETDLVWRTFMDECERGIFGQ